MTWVKLDDRTAHHPKILAAGPEAFALWVASLCYANSHHTDGFIPDSALAALIPGAFSTRKLNKLSEKLATVSLWIRGELGWFLHDYSEYQHQATKKFVEENRLKEREKKRKQRESGKLSPGDTKSVSPPCPDTPTRPDPSRPCVPNGTHTERAGPKRMLSSLAGIPHPDNPSLTFSSEEFVIEAFKAVGRTAGKIVVPSSITGGDRRELERIERMSLETIAEMGATDPPVEFARLVNGVMGRYRDKHRDDPERCPWKAGFIASRWAELSEGFQVAA